MDKEMKIREKPYNVCFMGASLETGNMGVSALAASLINIIYRIRPNADISFLIGNRMPKVRGFNIGGKKISIKIVNYRLSPKAKIKEHLFFIFLIALLQYILPKCMVKEKIVKSAPWLKSLRQADFVGNIHGGDSFSDIYGLRRFILGIMPDIIALLMKKKLIMLPQTYGPYNHSIAKSIARFILKRSTCILSRDREGLITVEKVLKEIDSKKLKFCPDVAFTLESVKPNEPVIKPPSNNDIEVPLIGINVNGLMYNGGYTRDNMFGLKFNYKSFVNKIVAHLLEKTSAHILLVPHTFGPSGNINSDPDASKEVLDSFADLYKNRVHLVMQEYDQSEIKGIIKLCDFFIGSRMHACIAALSQAIPTIGVAYSRKFKGVFDSIGSGDTVLDARSLDEETVISKIMDCYKKRNEIRNDVKEKIAAAQERIMAVFGDMFKVSQS